MPPRDFIDIHAFIFPTSPRALFVFCDVCAGSAATNANTPQKLAGCCKRCLAGVRLRLPSEKPVPAVLKNTFNGNLTENTFMIFF